MLFTKCLVASDVSTTPYRWSYTSANGADFCHLSILRATIVDDMDGQIGMVERRRRVPSRTVKWASIEWLLTDVKYPLLFSRSIQLARIIIFDNT